MSERVSSDVLRLVGENCRSYQSQKRGVQFTLGLAFGEEGVSCATCKNWSGEQCVIDAFDNVAVYIGFLPEEDE